jgi:predicted Zn-dependent peptidase
MAEESLQPSRGNGKRWGIAAEVEAITLAELQTFWDTQIKPGNARIVITGRFDAAAIRTRIETAFTNLAAGKPPALRNPADSSVRGTLVMGDAPTAVAIAIAAPAMSDPGYAAFLLLAARLMDKPAQPRTWEANYDPIFRPEILFITGPVGQAEQPEPAAGRMRTEVNAILTRPLDPAELAKTREIFRSFFEHRSVDPAICSQDTRGLAIARARGAQWQLDVAPIAKALVATTKENLDEAAKAFDPKGSAAVIAGGVVR